MKENVLWILTTLFGGTTIFQFLFHKLNKRQKTAEVRGVEFEVSDKERSAWRKEIDDIRKELAEVNALWLEATRKNSQLSVRLVAIEEAWALAEAKKCEVFPCLQRQPPRVLEEYE